MTSKGQNVWYDLMTPDVEAAQAFYSEVVGWKTEAWPDNDPNMPYTMWMVGERAIGGVMNLPKEAAAMGAPPHWLAYTTVDDVDATLAQVEKLGGKTLKPAWDIPKVGRLSIVADPQGAVFALFKPVDAMPRSENKGIGEISWTELNTTDYEAAWKFYSELFDWKHTSSMEMAPGEVYFMWNDESETTKGGMSNSAAQMNTPPHWLHYINVDDCDSAVERIKQHGGKVINGPMDIPGDDRIAQCADPQGAMFAVYSSGKK